MKQKYYRTYVFTIQLSGGIHYYAGKRVSRFANVNDDAYTGSGKIIRAAFKKYGYDMYISREWQEHETEELMNEFEELLITEYKEKYDNRCINIASGGEGGNLLKYASKERKAKYKEVLKLAHSNDITRSKHSAASTKFMNDPITKERHRAACLIAQNSPEVKIKQAIARTKANSDPTKKRNHQQSAKRWQRKGSQWTTQYKVISDIFEVMCNAGKKPSPYLLEKECKDLGIVTPSLKSMVRHLTDVLHGDEFEIAFRNEILKGSLRAPFVVLTSH